MTRVLVSLLLLSAISAVAADKERATPIRSVDLHASPSSSSDKVMTVDRGTELTTLEQTNVENQPWLKVSVAVPGTSNNAPSREVTGWAPAKAIVAAGAQNGDEIIYGEAVNSEQQAERSGGRKGAADDAMRLYSRIAELFPNSPLAGEAMWRSADIRWQLDRSKGGKNTDDQYLQQVISRFPKTKWADLAAYDLLDNQLCGEWNGLADCPEKEAALYENYARQHPQSPKFGEALYNAAYRLGGVGDIYRMSGKKPQSEAAHSRALALLQELAGNRALGEWSYRAEDLMYKLQQNVPLYGVEESDSQ